MREYGEEKFTTDLLRNPSLLNEQGHSINYQYSGATIKYGGRMYVQE
jgi:hypothetical protein